VNFLVGNLAVDQLASLMLGSKRTS